MKNEVLNKKIKSIIELENKFSKYKNITVIIIFVAIFLNFLFFVLYNSNLINIYSFLDYMKSNFIKGTLKEMFPIYGPYTKDNYILQLNFIFMGFILAIISSIFLHSFAAKLIINRVNFNQEKYLEEKSAEENKFFQFVKFLLSPDLYLATYYKKQINNELRNVNLGCEYHNNIGIEYYIKDEDKYICECEQYLRSYSRRTFILLSNYLNLIYSIILALLVIFAATYFPNHFFIYIIIPRLISRSLEILSAFYRDVVWIRIISIKKPQLGNSFKFDIINDWKTSSIRKAHRISLAVHSLLEIILSFSIVYFVLFDLGLSQYEKAESFFFYESFLHCVSLSLFNFSLATSYKWWEKILHVWQLVVSFNLIVLSVASYINLKDELSSDEKEYFLNKDKYK